MLHHETNPSTDADNHDSNQLYRSWTVGDAVHLPQLQPERQPDMVCSNVSAGQQVICGQEVLVAPKLKVIAAWALKETAAFSCGNRPGIQDLAQQLNLHTSSTNLPSKVHSEHLLAMHTARETLMSIAGSVHSTCYTA